VASILESLFPVRGSLDYQQLSLLLNASATLSSLLAISHCSFALTMNFRTSALTELFKFYNQFPPFTALQYLHV